MHINKDRTYRWVTLALAGVTMSGLAYAGAAMMCLGMHNLGLAALALMLAVLVGTSQAKV